MWTVGAHSSRCSRTVSFAPPPSSPTPPRDFPDVHRAHLAFQALAYALRRYDAAMGRAAPLYDPTSPQGGPPFDMWYHLEVIDRLRRNVSLLVDETDARWNELLLDDDVP